MCPICFLVNYLDLLNDLMRSIFWTLLSKLRAKSSKRWVYLAFVAGWTPFPCKWPTFPNKIIGFLNKGLIQPPFAVKQR